MGSITENFNNGRTETEKLSVRRVSEILARLGLKRVRMGDKANLEENIQLAVEQNLGRSEDYGQILRQIS